MKLFSRSGGYWLFWTTTIYFLVGMFDLFVYNFTSTEYIQVVWITIVALPLFFKPLANWLNMDSLWDTMFNPFKSKTKHVEELMKEIKEVSKVTPVEEQPKPPAYEIGLTEDGRTTLRMGGPYGSSTLTMNETGVRQLIRMLESTLGEMEEENV